VICPYCCLLLYIASGYSAILRVTRRPAMIDSALTSSYVRTIGLLTEAQLSQRDRATFRVIEYFAKSLKVIRNDTVA